MVRTKGYNNLPPERLKTVYDSVQMGVRIFDVAKYYGMNSSTVWNIL